MHVNGRSRRMLFACTNSAASSLPVPVSPVIRTVQLEAAIRASASLMSRRGLLDPIMSTSRGNGGQPNGDARPFLVSLRRQDSLNFLAVVIETAKRSQPRTLHTTPGVQTNC